VKDRSDEADCCSNKVESDRDRRQQEATRSEVGEVGKNREAGPCTRRHLALVSSQKRREEFNDGGMQSRGMCEINVV
jgi:hypothetical protein